MPGRLSAPFHTPRGPWWPPFVAGVAAGVLGGLVLARRPGRALARAWAGASRRMSSMREALQEPEPLDLERLRAHLLAMEGGHRLHLRDMGDGILEVVGTAHDAHRAGVLLDALSREPGVRVVVNRVWTPSSVAPAGED